MQFLIVISLFAESELRTRTPTSFVGSAESLRDSTARDVNDSYHQLMIVDAVSVGAIRPLWGG